jgi:hypothetical protein
MRRRVGVLLGVVLSLSFIGSEPALAALGDDNPPSIDVIVETPGGSGGGRPETAEDGGAGSSGGDGGGAEAGEAVGAVPVVGGCATVPVGAVCGGDGAEEPAAPAAPAFDPVVLAQAALDSAPIALPEPHTSPDGVPQMTGLATWFWLEPGSWEPVSARAELPGIWAEVTATPTRATWTPGDGSAAVVCTGPGRPHPGSAGATTDCGHTYVDVGSYTLVVEVTYTVTWTSSTGASAALDPITVGAELPVTVEQRQAVID